MGPDEGRTGSSPEVSGIERVEDYVWESQSPERVKTRLGDMADAHLEHALNCVRTWGTKAEHRVEQMLEDQRRRFGPFGPEDPIPSRFFRDEWERLNELMSERRRGPQPVMNVDIIHESRKAKTWWEWERRLLAEQERRRRIRAAAQDVRGSWKPGSEGSW